MMALWIDNARSALVRLRDDHAGIALTEFAAWTSVLFVLIMVALDFGGYYIARGSINEAISAAAVRAFNAGENVDFANLPAYVRNMAENQDLAVSVSCNGEEGACTNTNRTCACLRSDATYTSFTCGATCTGNNVTANSVAGYYLTIRASQSYTPVLVPQSLLSGARLSQATTVRLQ
ncbi:pilus assembly protein [Novosphingobium profundi]|uniref:TadE/TadG family type IV pilus assembly protein n=1 Tax=Novosphingobium profundi TaxID=1774954 RepID=UPI001BDA9FD1|nr:TadE family protein [Novosphingobium profundi]MBT0668545.1 pilus assembly protein [Novosphingobium profundi]